MPQSAAPMPTKYTLPDLPYKYDALQPVISQKIMTLHHDKHHAAYVTGANAALEKLDKARKGEATVDIRAVLRDYSFNFGGHALHSIFWPNMAPPGKGGGTPGGALADQINADFGSFDKFKQQFSDAAKTVEGSGWALLLYDNTTNQLVLTQIEKQNNMHLPQLPILLTLDMWEHAWYLDYLNDKAKYVDEWWKVANFDNVADRFDKAKK